MPISRRSFAASAAAGVLVRAQAPPRPNIVWITCEDTGPQLGCYGDAYANTPNLDKLAKNSLRYRTAWSNAPVCAPARTTIISGLYPTSTGAEHMRSMTSLPASMRMYPCYLRDAGYYATNNDKEDYNLNYTGGSQAAVWDDSSRKAHWRNRSSGQPFFSIFNFTTTHESQIRRRPHNLVHDPAKVRIPAYHPDTPEVRHDWAQYYDNITTMDEQAGAVLKQLEDGGLLSDTIVFFYGDHGSGMPRSKRWPYNSGLQVPLLVHIPEKYRSLAPKDYRPGGVTGRLVSFVDLAPTVLSLAGIQPAAHFQGGAFLGTHQAAPHQFLHGFRGRMDERYDCVRSVRDERYVYIRNYMPHEIYGQHIAYMFETPTTRVWRELFDAGKLNAAQSRFWQEKPAEELYDLERDPDEVNNLASSPAHSGQMERLREAQRAHLLQVRDVGLLPEDEIHARGQGSSPFEMARDSAKYPLERIHSTAEVASQRRPDQLPRLVASLKDSDSGVRYWAALGLLMLERHTELAGSLNDPAPAVRIVAAEAQGRFGAPESLPKALDTLLALSDAAVNSAYVSMQALNAIQSIGKKAAGAKPKLAELQVRDPKAPARVNEYAPRMVKTLLSTL
jgi:uncharacterized sulfatase